MIIMKVTKNQGCTLSKKHIGFWKNHRGGGGDGEIATPPAPQLFQDIKSPKFQGSWESLNFELALQLPNPLNNKAYGPVGQVYALK